MKNESVVNYINNLEVGGQAQILHNPSAITYPTNEFELVGEQWQNNGHDMIKENKLNGEVKIPEILLITSYPPRECGIATYSQDLVKALNSKFRKSFQLTICAIESDNEIHSYPNEIKYVLNTSQANSFTKIAFLINKNEDIQQVMVQHEFGFFEKNENDFHLLLENLTKPIIISFHTVLPNPDDTLKHKVQVITKLCESIIVMTHSSAEILIKEYGVEKDKITLIAHGTHLVKHDDKKLLKNKYELSGKKILSTFGLLSSGKGIETTIEALPAIVASHRDTVFLIIGKTHPNIAKQEGEKYRQKLEARIAELQMQQHVQFINYFLPQDILLEYLQLTDIYLFTSRDPNQAVSGTFSYAISCGCPVISTPIPHAMEVLKDDSGIIIDFDNSQQMSEAVIHLLNNDVIRKNISSNGLHKMASTAWENAAIAHAKLFEKLSNDKITLHYSLPPVNLDHIKKLTSDFGMIQFSKINQPDIKSGYTLDDNARALIAMCQHFERTNDEADLEYITIYFNFINYCLQDEGYFLNYVNEEKIFTDQNSTTNLADSNGRAIWALGYMISISNILPQGLSEDAEITMQCALSHVSKIYSTRAMAFAIKGLYYRNSKNQTTQDIALMKELANRLVQMYRHESTDEWQWFESYFTYANSLLPEALLCTWITTQEDVYKDIAKKTFDFLISKTFNKKSIHVISNKSWMHRGIQLKPAAIGGEQPIDVAYTILALNKFYNVFKEKEYQQKMEIAFNWFLGNNHLNQVIYNPCTGGCYDGLEENNVNLNQGAESSVSYLMARLTVGKSFRKKQSLSTIIEKHVEKNELILI